MKIRSYKGTSPQALYETIQKELGPNAVVVSNRQTTTMKGMMPKREYELIAVVDDASADRHLFEGQGLDHEALERIGRRQEQMCESLEASFETMRREIKQTYNSRMAADTSEGGGASRVPTHARDWDCAFVRRLQTKAPEALTGDGPAAYEALGQALSVCERFPVRQRRSPHIVVLVGPTGSGKTTTLAKLAARWSLDDNLNIGIITTDTYRIAAVDQTREYATLLGVEMRVAFSAGEARLAVEAFADKDVILVDTPGRNHLDRVGMTSMHGILESMGAVTVLMTLPATMDRRGVPAVLKSFSRLHPDYVVLTKIDEAADLSLLTAVAARVPWPLAFMTNGQQVPKDILDARLSDVVHRLMGQKECVPVAEPVAEASRGATKPKPRVGRLAAYNVAA